MNKTHGQCEVCQKHESKYTCPRCGLHSCSLDCFKKHKTEKSCSGLSDASMGTRDSYVDKKSMKTEDVQRDYNFLLKVNRSLELTKRNKHDLKTMVQRRGKAQARRHFPSHMDEERGPPCINQRGARVMKLPFGMERGKSNKSSGKGNNWSWTVEWLLVDSQLNTLQKYTRYRSNESATLKSLIPEGWVSTNEDGTTENYMILLKNLDERNLYEELSPDLKLSEALLGRLIIEYPTLYISKENVATNKSFGVIPLHPNQSDLNSTSASESSSDDSSSSSSEDNSSSDSEPYLGSGPSGSDSGSDSESDDAPEESSSKDPLQA